MHVNRVTGDASPAASSAFRTVAVRLEGGVGDHILGMRVLRFIRDRFPAAEICLYSDAAGHQAQLSVAELSPLAIRVVPIFRVRPPTEECPTTSLDLFRSEDLELMRGADLLLDAHGDLLFLDAVLMLDVPLYDILSAPPQLCPPASAIDEAERLLHRYPNAVFVGVNVTKWDKHLTRELLPVLLTLCRRLLEEPNVFVLNVFTSGYDYSHWPEPIRQARQRVASDNARLSWDLCARHEKIIPCVDLSLPTVAALLTRCRYFVGVDNGIKHLAWALGIPLTFIHPDRPSARHITRWMPDLHRMLLPTAGPAECDRHVSEALDKLTAPSPHTQYCTVDKVEIRSRRSTVK